MSSFTRQAIMDSFLRLLLHKPFRKVTVRDIVEECGVNRTTFYYYYQDIYAIAEDVVIATTAPYAAALLGEGRPEDRRDAADFMEMHRRALLGLWEGLGSGTLRKMLGGVLREPAVMLVARAAGPHTLTPAEREGVVALLLELLFGSFYLLLRGELAVPFDTVVEAAAATAEIAIRKMRSGKGDDRG